MIEPTQAQVKKTIAKLQADMKYQSELGRYYADCILITDLQLVCAAAEHSLAPATPTETEK